ncbi:MAG: DUF305 domain-containing protein [Hyphomicrobiales bacterium]|nr:DUF305 domain-containing protein [Hyphomicrobiales bacterium]
MTSSSSRAETNPCGRRARPAKWRAAALLGLISSSFSTLVSQFTAGRIGRDPAVDWMTVAMIPLRDSALAARPDPLIDLVGVLFHQLADFSWAVFFFGVMGRWTASLTPMTIALIAPPWAAFTSAMEWLLLVPLLPFWQPTFPLEQPYWVGFLVHLSSSMMYPIFPWLKGRMEGRPSGSNARFAARWAGGAASVVAALALLAWLGANDHEIPWSGGDVEQDQAFIRRMTTHHEQGIEIAAIAGRTAQNGHLRALARLMEAEQRGEVRIFDAWRRSWFPLAAQFCSPEERATMPGMLTDAQMDLLRSTKGAAFDALFVILMSFHHAGAAEMANDELNSDGDLRLRVMGQAIRHGQQGEIAMMRGAQGFIAVGDAVTDLFVMRQSVADLLKQTWAGR